MGSLLCRLRGGCEPLTRVPDLGNASVGRETRASPGGSSFLWAGGVKRAVIFANGEMSDPAVIRSLLRPDDWIIAADGGVRHALACGRPPHLVIGDMDSIPPAIRAELETQETEFLASPAAKDETDLELALLHAAAEGATDILVAGALGGRLDQTLANVQLLARPEIAPLHVQLVDGRLTATLIHQEATIHGQAGDRISLIPLGGDAQDVHASGLAWPLVGETLHFGEARGVSNVMTGEIAQIQLAGGWLICIHSPRRYQR